MMSAFTVFAARHAIEWRTGPLPPTLLNYFPDFAAGFLLADFYVGSWSGQPPAQGGWDAAALILWLALPAFCLVPLPAPTLFVAAGLFCAVFAALRSRYVKRALASYWVRTIGGWCYSFYLLHLLLLRVFVPWLRVPLDGATTGSLALGALIFAPPILAITAVYSSPSRNRVCGPTGGAGGPLLQTDKPSIVQIEPGDRVDR